MSNMKNILRDVGYFGIGAAAVILEAGGKAVKSLVQKGEETLRENHDTVDDLKRKAKDLGEKARGAIQKVASKPENFPLDAAELSPEERAELRRQLDEADAADADARPLAPDVIYHTDAPLPEEEPAEESSPEDGING